MQEEIAQLFPDKWMGNVLKSCPETCLIVKPETASNLLTRALPNFGRHDKSRMNATPYAGGLHWTGEVAEGGRFDSFPAHNLTFRRVRIPSRCKESSAKLARRHISGTRNDSYNE